jgi:prepilin-type N-terminal cleavage/methylation domain-containing protein
MWQAKQKHHNQGFTLLEIMMAMMVLAVLAAILLPHYLNQAGKARTAEARYVLGAINRVQQAYRFEVGMFATNAGILSDMTSIGKLQGDYFETSTYRYSVQAGANSQEVHHLAQPQVTFEQDTKQLTSAVYQLSDRVTYAVCQAHEVLVTPELVATDSCVNGEILN